MKKLLQPKWMLFINTLPIVILLFIFRQEYNIIHSLLSDENKRLLFIFGGVLAGLGVVNLVYTIYLMYTKKRVQMWYGFAALIAYIVFLYCYMLNLDNILPSDIPNWMTSGNLVIHVGTFLMPTLLYALLVLVIYFTPKVKRQKAGSSLLGAFLTPASWFLFYQIFTPLWSRVGSDFAVHVFVVLTIAIIVLFLFFLIRITFIMIYKKSDFFAGIEVLWKVILGIVFPLLGLFINNIAFGSEWTLTGVFGNFNSVWFYILAIVNGILLCLPDDIENKHYRLILFMGRCITYAFICYFFLVFMPYLPLSVAAIIALGLGLLMLTPLMLFMVQTVELTHDFAFLKKYYSKTKLMVIGVACFMCIPAIITISYVNDKRVLNKALTYMYTPDYSKNVTINKESLRRTLQVVENEKTTRDDFIFTSQTPFLSPYFRWLVLDNMTLSDNKINQMRKVFFGVEPLNNDFTDDIQNEGVEITGISSESTFDGEQWISRINMEITNFGNAWRAEYATTFELPEGCWISDYYLYVGDRKEMGLLTEKKSAMWVYSQIRGVNRDPGILYYLTGNKIAFRVFPFQDDEIRKTGIEFIHKEPFELNFDGHALQLGNSSEQPESSLYNNEAGEVIYISSAEKKQLQQVYRKPYYHFIVDTSGKQKEHVRDNINIINGLLQQSPDNAMISYVNTTVNTFSMQHDWAETYEKQSFSGGFFLDRAIRKSLFDAYQSKSYTYPVFVVLTDDLTKAVINKDFADMQFTFPENDMFFCYSTDRIMYAHSLTGDPLQPVYQTNAPIARLGKVAVLAYPGQGEPIAFLRNNDKPEIAFKSDVFRVDLKNIHEKNWLSGLHQQGIWRSHVLHPDISNVEWVELVKCSFASKIMTPLTSYIVVENEAQKAALLRKQDQVLAGDKSLDTDDDAQRMSEPGLLLLVCILGVWMYKRKKK